MEKKGIRTQAQFEKLADRFVGFAVTLQSAKASKNEAIKRAQGDYDRVARRIEEKMETLEEAFAKYLRKNKALLDKKKSVQIGRLLLGFRVGNPILLDRETEGNLEAEELVGRIQAMMEDGNSRMRQELRETLKTETKPVLSAVKALPARLLDSLKLEVHQGEDLFWKIIE